MDIRVSGDISKVQSSLDFYLQLTSVGSKSIEELRKEYFNKFMSEELERRKALLKGTDSLEEKVSEGRVPDVEEVPNERTSEMVSSGLDFLKFVSESPSRSVEDVQEEPEEEFEWSENDFEWEDEPAEDEVKGSEDDSEEFEWEDEPTDTANDSDEFEWEDEKIDPVPEEKTVEGVENYDFPDDTEFVSHGYYVEEPYPVGKGEEKTEKVEESLPNGVEYVSHGYFVEESRRPQGKPVENVGGEFNFDEESEESDEGFESMEEPEESSNTAEFVFEESEDTIGDSEFIEEETALGDSDDTVDNLGLKEGKSTPNSSDDTVEDFEFEEEEPTPSSSDGIGVSYAEDDEEDWDFFEEEPETGDIVEEDISQVDVSPPPKKVEEIPKFKSEISMEDEGSASVDVPADLREFLRQHPCSPVSYVLKFYSKKEIDKQLALGRVYKKKGKLMI